MKDLTPALFPLEPLAEEPVQLQPSEEIERSIAMLLLQALEVEEADDEA